MRGAPSLMSIISCLLRIIPADAGSTCWPVKLGAEIEDHPRGCGEHMNSRELDAMYRGSSPRMRGARDISHAVNRIGRIIPADAGSTWPVIWLIATHWDHPRGCGEHQTIPGDDDIPVGSSPRMRGAPSLRSHMALMLRIIPADAGSTDWIVKVRYPGPDHPRGCGEHCDTDTISAICHGSSPRMRGAQSKHST